MKSDEFWPQTSAFTYIPVKLPWIFPGAPLKINRVPGNIQGHLTGMVYHRLCVSLHLMSPEMSFLGWGLLRRFPPSRYFPNFWTSPKYMLAIEYEVHIWQVLPQLSCGDTCQIWMWFKDFKRYFCEIENFAYGEIDERSFSNPHPWSFIFVWENKTPHPWVHLCQKRVDCSR